jgi:hypothetical protein
MAGGAPGKFAKADCPSEKDKRTNADTSFRFIVSLQENIFPAESKERANPNTAQQNIEAFRSLGVFDSQLRDLRA